MGTTNWIKILLNTLTPMSDQDRISPYNINTKIKKSSDENLEEYRLGDH